MDFGQKNKANNKKENRIRQFIHTVLMPISNPQAHMSGRTNAHGAHQTALRRVELLMAHINLLHGLESARLGKVRRFMYVCAVWSLASRVSCVVAPQIKLSNRGSLKRRTKLFHQPRGATAKDTCYRSSTHRPWCPQHVVK